MSNNWDIYFTTVDEEQHFASVLLDLDVWKEIDQAAFAFPSGIRITIKNPAKSGGPVDQESELLNALEDKLIDEIEGKGLNVGRITSNGLRDLFYYFQEPVDLHIIAQSIFGEYDYDVKLLNIDEEEPWEFYHNFLYPNKYEMNQMYNRKVIDSLVQAGDTLEEPREVDHCLFFNTEEDQVKFIESIAPFGFEIEEIPGDSGEFIVNLYRIEKIDNSNMNALTNQLIQLAEEANGEYDGWGCEVVKEND